LTEKTIDFKLAGEELRTVRGEKRKLPSAKERGRKRQSIMPATTAPPATANAEAAAELAVPRDHADYVPTPRKKKKPNIWEIIERKKQTTNAKQKKAKAKDGAYGRDKKGKKRS
jgi:hypothetical protein